MNSTYSLRRRTCAEGAGTAGLVLSIFGGGHFAHSVGATPAEAAIIGTLAVVGTFICVLQAIGPVSDGHINPAVTASFLILRRMTPRHAAAYIAAQIIGAVGGALAANLLWGSDALSLGSSTVSGAGYVAECLAAGGLVAVIHGTIRGGASGRLPIVVPSFLAAASFAAPFGFANPAVAVAKTLAGAGPSATALAGLLVCEIGAAVIAAIALAWLYRPEVATEAQPQLSTAPSLPTTFELITTPSSEPVLAITNQIVKGLIRPGDFVTRHQDGRLLVLLDAVTDAARTSFERRANSHLGLALDAAGLPAASVALRPLGPRHGSTVGG